MTGFDWVPGLAGVGIGGAVAASALFKILTQLIEVRRHLSQLALEFESKNGERIKVKLNPNDPDQAKELAELFVNDTIVAVDPLSASKDGASGPE